jgi:hypothetical protein
LAAPGALVWRLGPASLRDFEPGEQIIAFGDWRDSSTFVGTDVEPLLYPLRGEISSRDGSDVATTSGDFEISRARPYAGAGGVNPGPHFEAVAPRASIDALVLRNIDTGRALAYEVEVVTGASR